MFCKQCGMRLTEDTLFCPNCGAKVSEDQTGYEDDKTVILHEEQPDAAQTEDEPVEVAEAVEAAEKAETVDTEKTVETAETAGVGDENLGAEESFTGITESSTVVAVSNTAGQKRFCPNCGAPNGIDDQFCQQCGMFLGNAAEKSGKAALNEIHKGKKGWKIAAAAVAVLAVAGVVVVFAQCILSGSPAKDKEPDFVMYLKDNELTMARKNKYEPMAIGDRMYDDIDDGNGGWELDGLIQYSSDRQYVYYPQKFDSESYDLYRKKLDSKMTDEQKIDSGIIRYELIDNDRLVYIKDKIDRKLYLYRNGDAEKIASDVWGLWVSGDGKYLMWRDEDDRLYVQKTDLKSDKVKLDSDVTSIYATSDNLDTIVYQKDDKLYVMKGMGEKEKIASDVSCAYVYGINKDLKIYYMKEGEHENLNYYDLIEDDYLAQDQQTEEPKIEDYQKVTYKDSFWGMQESVEVSDSYYKEVEKYEKKQQRDSLRLSLENSSLMLEQSDIYYYDDAEGDSRKVLTVSGQLYGNIAYNSALMYAYNVDLEKVESPKLSKFENSSYDDIQQEVIRRLCENRQLLYLADGEVHEIEDYEAGSSDMAAYLSVWTNEDRHIIYIQDRVGEAMRLYSYNYGQKDASLELITDELMQVLSCGTDDVYYFNVDDELYYGKTKIAEDCAGVGNVYEDGEILYLTDMDKNGEEGTLHLYRNGKDTEIADNVAPAGGYGMFDSDKVVFLTDYNFKKYRGDLQVYDGKDVKMIDMDVTRIFF